MKLWKGSLPSSQAKTLQIHAKRRRGLVKETKRCFFVAGGDNKAESRFGAIKVNLRRMNNVGRFVASSRKKRVQVLAAARLHRCPGLFEVLTALKEYRVACSEGYAKVSPSNHKKKMLLEIQKKTDAALEGKKQLKTLYCRVGERPGLGVYIYIWATPETWCLGPVSFNGSCQVLPLLFSKLYGSRDSYCKGLHCVSVFFRHSRTTCRCWM